MKLGSKNYFPSSFFILKNYISSGRYDLVYWHGPPIMIIMGDYCFYFVRTT